jgi:hypothetical protein
MVRTYKRKKPESYSPQLLKQALDAVQSGVINPNQAEREFKIPRSTIRLNLKKPSDSVGRPTIFSLKQEENLCNRIIYVCQRGFPLKVAEFLKVVCLYGKRLQRRKSLQGPLPLNWLKTGRASEDWWKLFKKRHPLLALRSAQGLSNARAEAFNEDRVNSFFVQYAELIKSLDLGNLSSLVYNCDETALN